MHALVTSTRPWLQLKAKQLWLCSLEQVRLWKSWIFGTGIQENAKTPPAGLCHESTWVVNLPGWGHMWCWSVTANITSHPVSRQTQLPMNWSYTSQRESSGMWRVRITETVRKPTFNLRQQTSAVESFSCITPQLTNIGKVKNIQ